MGPSQQKLGEKCGPIVTKANRILQLVIKALLDMTSDRVRNAGHAPWLRGDASAASLR
jgi:hypothetical protein